MSTMMMRPMEQFNWKRIRKGKQNIIDKFKYQVANEIKTKGDVAT